MYIYNAALISKPMMFQSIKFIMYSPSIDILTHLLSTNMSITPLQSLQNLVLAKKKHNTCYYKLKIKYFLLKFCFHAHIFQTIALKKIYYSVCDSVVTSKQISSINSSFPLHDKPSRYHLTQSKSQ